MNAPTTTRTAAGLARDLAWPVPACLIGILLLALAGRTLQSQSFLVSLHQV